MGRLAHRNAQKKANLLEPGVDKLCWGTVGQIAISSQYGISMVRDVLLRSKIVLDVATLRGGKRSPMSVSAKWNLRHQLGQR